MMQLLMLFPNATIELLDKITGNKFVPTPGGENLEKEIEKSVVNYLQERTAVKA